MASQKDKVDFFDPSHITEPVHKRLANLVSTMEIHTLHWTAISGPIPLQMGILVSGMPT